MTVGEIDTLTPLRHNICALVPVDGVTLKGYLSLPTEPRGLVLLAHGSSQSRHSKANHDIAERLYERSIATLTIDMLTEDEDNEEARFDTKLLSARLSAVISWVYNHSQICNLPLGLFGASAGGGTALMVAAMHPQIRAVVSRGGRPDMVSEHLGNVDAPTLLIVGGNDKDTVHHNQMSLVQLNDRSHLEVIPGVTHRFSEEGATEKVAELSAAWFEKHLSQEEN